MLDYWVDERLEKGCRVQVAGLTKLLSTVAMSDDENVVLPVAVKTLETANRFVTYAA